MAERNAAEVLTLKEAIALLTPVAAALGFEPQRETFKSYHRALRDVPAALLQFACERALQEPRDRYQPRFPTAPEFRRWAEDARQGWIKANPWEPCEACVENPGWVEAIDGAGIRRLSRCVCVKAYRDRMEQSGVAQRLALPPAPVPDRDDVDA